MRVLFATTANLGHVGPMIPLVRACQQEGVEVLVAAPASFASRVREAGFPTSAFGEPTEDDIAAAIAATPAHGGREAANLVMIRDVFGRLRGTAARAGMHEAIEEFRPDLIVREPAEVASLVAAESLGIPHVQTGIGVLDTLRLLLGMLSQSFPDFEEAEQLVPGTLLHAASTAPLYTIVPAGFDREVSGLPTQRSIHRFREEVDDEREPLPEWGDRKMPLVYVTFGTRPAPRELNAHRSALDALKALPARVLIAVGPDVDPESLRPWPHNALVHRVPPRAVMSSAAVVVTHGGFGTTVAALASGTPQVVMPLFASDQWINAARVEATGVGHALIADPPPWEQLARTVRRAIDERGASDAATHMEYEMRRLPPPAAMVMRLRDDAGIAAPI